VLQQARVTGDDETNEDQSSCPNSPSEAPHGSASCPAAGGNQEARVPIRKGPGGLGLFMQNSCLLSLESSVVLGGKLRRDRVFDYDHRLKTARKPLSKRRIR
jgi:hypothetical protein